MSDTNAQPQPAAAGSSHPYVSAQPDVPAANVSPAGFNPAATAPASQYNLPATNPLAAVLGNAPAPAPVVPQAQPEQPAPTGSESVNEAYEFQDAVSQGLYQGLAALADTKGVDLVQAFGPAYESGNPAYINHAYLQQVAPELASVLVQQATALINHESTRTQATISNVHQMAGGSEQWGSAVQQFNAGAPAEVREVIKSLIDSGNPNSLKYAVDTVLGYGQSSGQIPFQQGNQINPAQTQASGYGQVMTKEAYFQAEAALAKQYGLGTPEYTRQFEALAAQRQQARQRGQ